ncbi:MAG: AAA family ATPase [Ferruginibacter sp.]
MNKGLLYNFLRYSLPKASRATLATKDLSKSGPETEIEEKEDTSGDDALNKLIGLSGVKSEVKTLTNMAALQKQRKERGKKVVNSSLHLVFTGNPGTGKTTVARNLGKIFAEIGVLKKGHLIEADRAKLVGEYIGHTEKKVTSMFDKANEGVLFIDEAYSLASAGGNDFGSIAIDTIIKLMEDRRDSVAVVVAGYTGPMKKFISLNPGLQSRFTRYINFEDYSCDELVDIYNLMADDNQYDISSEAFVKVKSVLAAHWETRDDHFGNGRDVRTFFERSIERQATRIVNSKCYNDLDSIIESDIPDKLIIKIKD